MRSGHSLIAVAIYAVLLAAFWALAQHFSLSTRIGHMSTTFTAFALILAPYWFFGFGMADSLRRVLTWSSTRVLAPGLLVLPYILYSLPQGEFHWKFLIAFLAIPVGISALFEFLPPAGAPDAAAKICWQDVVALAACGIPVEFHWIEGSFPHSGLTSLSKLLLVDSALYAFLVVRRLDHVGYDFVLRARDLIVGIRELLFFAPIVLSLGLALHFITPHRGLPSAATVISSLLITFFFVAVPEELFFRGLLQNLLEPRVGRVGALCASSVIFGLSHFNNPLPFNWRYVLLATIAGFFYGRAWCDRRRLLASATTHTLVDVLWSLWFR
ncbi:MAG TPA: CPBP family intramembrane glutamic endopeptidase [Terriglobales bacterium]